MKPLKDKEHKEIVGWFEMGSFSLSSSKRRAIDMEFMCIVLLENMVPWLKYKKNKTKERQSMKRYISKLSFAMKATDCLI